MTELLLFAGGVGLGLALVIAAVVAFFGWAAAWLDRERGE